MTDQKSNPPAPAIPTASRAACTNQPAFVKVSTSLANRLASIDPSALKVWLYLSLSINRDSGQAHPGIRTIARVCGLAPNTVTAAVKRLEALGLLAVKREKKKNNIYGMPAYVSADSSPAADSDTPGRSVSSSDTPDHSVPIDPASVPGTGTTPAETVPTAGTARETVPIDPASVPSTGTAEPDGMKTVPTTGTTPAEPVPTIGTVEPGSMKTVPTTGTAGETVPIDPASVPIPGETVPASWGLNQINQIQPDNNNNKAAAIFKSYPSGIGLITPRIRDKLNETLDVLKLPPEWIIQAIQQAAAHNQRSWAYCAAILKRWAAEGKTALPKDKSARPRPPPRWDHSDIFKQRVGHVFNVTILGSW